MQTRTTTPTESPVTTRTRETRTVLDACTAHHAAALELLACISEHLANHDDAPVEGPDTDIAWGHVGDIADTRKTTQEPSDRLLSEGECAEVACLRCPATFGSTTELDRHYRRAH
jgi:hypothetical protein